MPDIFIQIIIVSLIVLALSFYLIAFIVFYCSRITKKNSISINGTLVGFRRYYITDQWGADISEDYPDNKKGRVPIFKINIDGEDLDISTSTFYNNLTSKDIGTNYKLRYRRFIGIALVLDEDKSLEKYNKKKNIGFGIFLCVATCMLVSTLLFI